MSSGRTWSTGLIHDRCLDIGELFTWTISPSSTIELLAVKLAEVFRAPLNTTKLAPVTFRSWKQEGLMLFFNLSLRIESPQIHIPNGVDVLKLYFNII